MGIGPGSAASLMPPQADDAARRTRDIERTQREQASAKSGQAMQVGAGGITVTSGGSVTVAGGGSVNVQDGGSLNILGSGAINVPSGGLNSAGSISAATTITAGGTIQGGGLVSTGGASVSGTLSAGAVSSGNVISSGQVQSNGSPIKSLPSLSYVVSTSYQACWINGDGTFGVSPSTELVKTGLTELTADDARRLLSLKAYWGRYLWDDDSTPAKVFFLAEDVAAAGFGPDVAPVAAESHTMIGPDGNPVIGADGSPVVIEAGQAYSVNYSQMVVPLVAAWQDGAAQLATMQATVTAQQAAIDALTARLAAAGIA